ncbi:hypothetical protein, partial [Streptomyces sp. NPDC054865]
GSVRGAGSNPLRVSQNAGLKVDAVLNVTGASTFGDNVSLSNTAKDLTVAGSVRGAGSNPLRVSQNAGLKVDAVLNVTGASTFNNSITTTGGVTAAGNITAGGNRVLRAGDTLRFVGLSSKYLTEDYDYGGETTVVKTFRTLYRNANWRAQHISSASSFREEPEGMQEPEALALDERTVTPDPEL